MLQVNATDLEANV